MRIITIILCTIAILSCSEKSPKKIPFVEQKTIVVNSTVAESFRPQLDIIFVVDDSASMYSYQQNLSKNIDKFAAAIVQTKIVDYHVGVITSSTNEWYGTACCGKLAGDPYYVDRKTPDGIKVLSKNVIVGTNGDATEAFFDPLYSALTEPNLSTSNIGFYRKDAYLAIIFITDTEDQSEIQTSDSMYNFLVGLKGSSDKLFVAAAYISKEDQKDPAKADCWHESDTVNLDGLHTFFERTKAQTFFLCGEYGQELAKVGELIARKTYTMYLKKIPDPKTIKITVGGRILLSHRDKGWTYNPADNTIVFGSQINWDSYPEGKFPEVSFEAIKWDFEDEKK